MESKLGLIQQSLNNRYSQWVREALDELPDNFTITDPSISGHPIVFASRGFLKMSGYAQEEVIGQNGKIFQGPKTNRRTVMEIREAIREERDIQVNLLNYGKDGTPFWMLFHHFERSPEGFKGEFPLLGRFPIIGAIFSAFRVLLLQLLQLLKFSDAIYM